MGYLHIDNLYKNQIVLLFKECYALEKIHGTSAHVAFDPTKPELTFFSGGEKYEKFIGLFDADDLYRRFAERTNFPVIVYGECYGGKMQAMSKRYGKETRFIAFDVQIGERWLTVPEAAEFVEYLGLDFVRYAKGPTSVEWLDAQRDLPSDVARRYGNVEVTGEGIVIRPLVEMTDGYGHRVIAKHKRDDFHERKEQPQVGDKLQVLEDAQRIANTWVTAHRLEHVLGKLELDGKKLGIESTKEVISAMIEDVVREAAGEIVDTKEARKAIGGAAAQMFKQHIQRSLANE